MAHKPTTTPIEPDLLHLRTPPQPIRRPEPNRIPIPRLRALFPPYTTPHIRMPIGPLPRAKIILLRRAPPRTNPRHRPHLPVRSVAASANAQIRVPRVRGVEEVPARPAAAAGGVPELAGRVVVAARGDEDVRTGVGEDVGEAAELGAALAVFRPDEGVALAGAAGDGPWGLEGHGEVVVVVVIDRFGWYWKKGPWIWRALW